MRPEHLVVTDTGVTTTAAFSAMYDFALDLIRRHNGARVARTTARVALVDDARASQTPYVDPRLLPQPGREFSQRVMRRLDQNLAERYDLAALANAFRVSTRTLLRRFAEETGRSPLAHLQASRVRRARHLLETTDPVSYTHRAPTEPPSTARTTRPPRTTASKTCCRSP